MNPGGIRKLTSLRNWSPSSRSSLRMKELKLPASGFDVPAISRGLNGPHLTGAGPAVGAVCDVHERRRVLWRQAPRSTATNREAVDVERALGRRRHQAAVGGEQVQVELSNGTCGRSVHRHGQLPGVRVGVDVGDQLCVDAETVEDHEEPVLVAGQRLCRCRASRERVFEGRRVDLDRPDLRVVRAGARQVQPEPAWSSLQEVWPSAASGLIVEAGGQGQGRRAQGRRRWRFAFEELLGPCSSCPAPTGRRLRASSARG